MSSRESPANPAAALREFGRRRRSGAEVRARVARGDASGLDRTAANIPAEAELRIVEQTADTVCFPLPPAPTRPCPTQRWKPHPAAAAGLAREHRRRVVMGPRTPDACLCGM